MADPERWTAAAVAARLGIAPATLRTWHRRHGLGPDRHEHGRHRRYSAGDVARLERFCALVADGLAVEAAALAAHRPAVDPAPAPDRPAAEPAAPAAEGAVRGLVSAARRLDGPAAQRTVADHLARHGVVATWSGLCVPALHRIDMRGGPDARAGCIAAEHVLSWAVTAALAGVTAAGNGAPPAVLLACAPGERHLLPLDAMRAALAERGVGVRTLGADVPAAALARAIARLRPRLVVLWSRTAATGVPGALPPTTPPTVVLPLGPGWADPGTPTDLAAALAATARALDTPARSPIRSR